MEQTSKPIKSNSILSTVRNIPFSMEQIFTAFAQPELLAQWWGPNGFTNTFEQFEFIPNGKWVFVMHDENGTNYPNESVFREIQYNSKIVIEHIVQPLFTLTISLDEKGNETQLTWEQEFESETFATKMRDFLETANEQNLDRLVGVLSDCNTNNN